MKNQIKVKAVADDRASFSCDGCCFYDFDSECPSQDALNAAGLPSCAEETDRYPRGFIYVEKAKKQD